MTANTATAEKVYYALLVPQNGVQLKVTVTTADGKMRTQTLGTTDLKSGENRRMDCNVQPADIQVKFSGPIAGWVDGDDKSIVVGKIKSLQYQRNDGGKTCYYTYKSDGTDPYKVS